MKLTLSPESLTILQNFSNINGGMLFQSGKEGEGTALATMDISQSFIAHATIKEVIPEDFFVNNLSRLLSILKLPNMKDASIDFKPHSLEIEGQSANMLFHYTDKDINPHRDTPVYDPLPLIEDPLFEAHINATDFDNFFKATHIVGHEYYTVRVKDGEAFLVGSLNRSTVGSHIASDDYTQSLGASDLPDFEQSFFIKYLKIISGDYKISVINRENSHGIPVPVVILANQDFDLTYMSSPATK